MITHALTLERLLCPLILLVMLSACDGTGPEPVETGHYFIDNRTDFTLRLEIDNVQFEDEIPPDTIFHFYTIEVGTGGSAAPYQTFNQFNVTAIVNPTDSVLYEGEYPEDGEDWEVRSSRRIEEKPGTEYYLSIPR